jgi:hypothetical protein
MPLLDLASIKPFDRREKVINWDDRAVADHCVRLDSIGGAL